MAKMLEAADLAPGMRVLEIGAGTGYNAALIHYITGTAVVTVESGAGAATAASDAIRASGLGGQVRVIHGDGYDGWRDGAPYDRIIVTCGIAGIPPGWLGQLADEAVIIAPVAHAGVHPVMAIDCQPGRQPAGRMLTWGDFMTAAGGLRPAGLFAHDPAVAVPASGACRIPGAAPALSGDGYHDLWCSLGTRDARTTRAYPDPDVFDLAAGTCAITDPEAGTAWIHRDGSLTLAGDRELADHLAGLVGQWDSEGRPSVGQWRARWRHAGTASGGLLLPGHWHL
jgi:protein-L-isoaspartate(D-aspartate) O-methyltransferase